MAGLEPANQPPRVRAANDSVKPRDVEKRVISLAGARSLGVRLKAGHGESRVLSENRRL
jgi:hypothetical protein